VTLDLGVKKESYGKSNGKSLRRSPGDQKKNAKKTQGLGFPDGIDLEWRKRSPPPPPTHKTKKKNPPTQKNGRESVILG